LFLFLNKREKINAIFYENLESEKKKKIKEKKILKKGENLENKENKENSLVSRSKSPLLEKNVLQEKNINENSINKSTPKKHEIYAVVKFDFSPKKVLI